MLVPSRVLQMMSKSVSSGAAELQTGTLMWTSPANLVFSLQKTQTKIMARIVLSVAIFACSALAAPQFTGDSSNARILQEQRFNAGAGKFGSAFAQEDGVVYREESAGNNERIGQYSYIGDDGKTYTVKYSAGVNGFR